MVTIQQIKQQQADIERALIGDFGTSARQRRSALETLERALRDLQRGRQARADLKFNSIKGLSVFGGRRSFSRGAPTGLPKQAVRKVTFIKERSSQRFTRGRAGLTPIQLETQRRAVRTSTQAELSKNGVDELKDFFGTSKKKVPKGVSIIRAESKGITKAKKRISELEAREQRFAIKFEDEIRKAKVRSSSRKELTALLNPLSRVPAFRKAIKATPDLILFAEKQFINTKAFGASLANIGDRALASKTVLAAAAIDSIQKGEGKKFLKKTFKDLKSQSKESRKIAISNVIAATKDPSTYFFALLGSGVKPQFLSKKSLNSLLKTKKAQAQIKGGKTVTKSTPNKNVRIKIRKIRRKGENIGEIVVEKRVGKGKFKFSSSAEFAIPKGQAKSLRGEFGRKPTLSQRGSGIGREKVGVQAFASRRGSGKAEFLTTKGVVQVSRIGKPFVNQISKQVKNLQRSVKQSGSSKQSTQLLTKQLKLTKEFQKISSRISKNTATKSDFTRFNSLQKMPQIQSVLKTVKGKAPQSQISGVRGIQTQGRGKVVAQIKKKLKSRARESRRTKLKVGSEILTKLEKNLLQKLKTKKARTIREAKRSKLKKDTVGLTKLEESSLKKLINKAKQRARPQKRIKLTSQAKSNIKQTQKIIDKINLRTSTKITQKTFRISKSKVKDLTKLSLAVASATDSSFSVKVSPDGKVKVRSLSGQVPAQKISEVLKEQLKIAPELIKQTPKDKPKKAKTRSPQTRQQIVTKIPKAPTKTTKTTKRSPPRKPPPRPAKKKKEEIIKIPGKLPKKPKRKTKKPNTQQGFVGQARGRGTKISKGKFKKGIFLSIGASTTRNRALRKAGNAANNTVSQSIRVVKGKMIKKKKDINKPRVLSLFGKPNKKGIRRELPKARINTPGELKGVTLKGLLAKRRKPKKRVSTTKKKKTTKSKGKKKSKPKDALSRFFS